MIEKSLLQKMDCLGVLRDGHFEKLSEIAEIHSYAKGVYVEREKEQTQALYIVIKGRVSIEIDLPDNRRITVYIVRPGDLFGWSAVVPPYEATASSRCLDDCEIIVLPRESLLQLLEDDIDLKASFMETIARVIRNRLLDTRQQMSYLLSG